MESNIIPGDSRYIPLTQQMWCCVPTCLQMVMLRHNIPLLPAELIGHHLGLIVDAESTKYFWNVSTGPKPSSGYGTRISLPQYSLESMFNKLNIPLKSELKLISNFVTIDEFRAYMQSKVKDNHDILACFDWPTLFNPTESSHWGHVCVIDKIDSDSNSVRLIDPSQSSAKWINVQITSMYQAMKFHGDNNSGGFWEISLR
jgi:hypothetical protein